MGLTRTLEKQHLEHEGSPIYLTLERPRANLWPWMWDTQHKFGSFCQKHVFPRRSKQGRRCACRLNSSNKDSSLCHMPSFINVQREEKQEGTHSFVRIIAVPIFGENSARRLGSLSHYRVSKVQPFSDGQHNLGCRPLNWKFDTHKTWDMCITLETDQSPSIRFQHCNVKYKEVALKRICTKDDCLGACTYDVHTGAG